MLGKGDRAILCYSFGLKFFIAFLGCIRAGVVAVPVYPPSPKNLPKALPKMTKIIKDSDAKVVLVDDAINLVRLNPLSKSRRLWPQEIKYKVHPKRSKSLTSHQVLLALNNIIKENPITSNDLAFLQYTSGSTGDPKGVMVTFGALNSNTHAIVRSVQGIFSSNGKVKKIIGFSWLPQYHDMGLIFTMIAPFLGGWNCNMISPVDFIKNPLLWIDLMSRLNINWSVAPNFAYRLAARKFIEAKKQLSKINMAKEPILNLDLSSLLFLCNAAEPIQLDTKDLFQEAFGAYGLSKDWFMSGYGLAESVVYVCGLHEYKISTYRSSNRQPIVAVGHRKLLSKGQIAKIVDPKTLQELKDNEVGELWLSGTFITAGYFGKVDLTNQQFHAKIAGHYNSFLRTGDLAFFEDDYLYICGRQKDLIIVNGVNHYPQDIENVVQNSSSTVRPGCVAAFCSDDTHADGNLEVVFEVRREFEQISADIVSTVQMKIVNEIGIMPTRVVAIKERTILKTTSGKIQRKANRDALHKNKFEIIHDLTNFDAFSDDVNDSCFETDPTSRDEQRTLQKFDTFDKIMVSYFGFNFDKSNTWDELGLESMTSISLRDAISDSFAITLDPDCLDIYVTPDALKAFVLSNQGLTLDVDLPSLSYLNQKEIPWFIAGILQLIGSFFLLLSFSVSSMPAWYIGKWLSDRNAYTEVEMSDSNSTVLWIWFPVMVPVWMISFSLLIVLLKWFIIWKYREGVVSIPSLMYVRWWVVDRAVALWEFWVGRFVIDTPLINLFYFLMGAEIHASVSIEAFVREFDLVKIHKRTSLQFQVHPRKFGIWNEKMNPSLRFRCITIGSNCTVKGMVSLGASINDQVLIDKLAVVPEGAKVPKRGQVAGNPGYIIVNQCSHSIVESDSQKQEIVNKNSVALGILKLMWLVFELYLFFAMIFLGQYLWLPYLPDWRYSDLLGWALLILWFSISTLGTSLVLKWSFIGKRHEGVVKMSLWVSFVDWAVDWHFQVATGLLISITSHSRIWNIILMMHGMDIDLSSRLAGVGSFPPSKVDLIKVKKSFISVASFTTNSNKFYKKISIENTSIGLLVHLSPGHTNLSITNTTVPPMTQVTATITQNQEDHRIGDFSTMHLIMLEVITNLGYMVSGGLFFCTLIPSYELWLSTMTNTYSMLIAAPILASCLVLQTISWTVLLACFQKVMMLNSADVANVKESSKCSCENFHKIIYAIYGTMAYAYQTYSFVNAFLGSPIFNLIIRCLGVTIEGRAIMYPARLYEHGLLAIADKTIVDGSQLTGHYVVYNDLVLGPCKVSGVMHEGTYAANAFIDSDESESLRAYVGTYYKKQQLDNPHTTRTLLDMTEFIQKF